MSNLRPLHDNVLVQVDQVAEAYLITAPDIEDQAGVNVWGTVLAVGPGRWTEGTEDHPPVQVPPELEVGDRVCFIKYHAKTKTGEGLSWILGRDKVLLRESDVLVYDPASKGKSEPTA